MNPDQSPMTDALRFYGEPVSSKQLALITQLVADCRGLNRTELANTVCELFAWTRPNGQLKTVECRQFLAASARCAGLTHHTTQRPS